MHLIREFWRLVRSFYRDIFRRKHLVFVKDGPFPRPLDEGDISFATYKRYDNVPEPLRRSMLSACTSEATEMNQIELANGADMHLAFSKTDSFWAGIVFTRRGRQFDSWYVPLDDDDVVYFRLGVRKEFRGHGIASRLLRYGMYADLQNGGRGFIDCRVYNSPSIRAIGRAGFRFLAKANKMKRSQAIKPVRRG